MRRELDVQEINTVSEMVEVKIREVGKLETKQIKLESCSRQREVRQHRSQYKDRIAPVSFQRNEKRLVTQTNQQISRQNWGPFSSLLPQKTPGKLLPRT